MHQWLSFQPRKVFGRKSDIQWQAMGNSFIKLRLIQKMRYLLTKFRPFSEFMKMFYVRSDNCIELFSLIIVQYSLYLPQLRLKLNINWIWSFLGNLRDKHILIKTDRIIFGRSGHKVLFPYTEQIFLATSFAESPFKYIQHTVPDINSFENNNIGKKLIYTLWY